MIGEIGKKTDIRGNRHSPSSSSVAPGRATKNGSEGTAPSSCQLVAVFLSRSTYHGSKIMLKKHVEPQMLNARNNEVLLVDIH